MHWLEGDREATNSQKTNPPNKQTATAAERPGCVPSSKRHPNMLEREAQSDSAVDVIGVVAMHMGSMAVGAYSSPFVLSGHALGASKLDSPVFLNSRDEASRPAWPAH